MAGNDKDPGELSLREIMALPRDQLESYRMAALAQISFDNQAPAAARVAALKALEPVDNLPGKEQSDNLSLVEIDEEITRLRGA